VFQFPTNQNKMLKGIFYSEFLNKEGAKILSQAPENLISSELFETISDYIIPKPQCCGKMIVFTHDQYQYLGMPQYISGDKYSQRRNAFLFNIVFVFSGYESVTHFKPVLKKLSNLLRSFEHEESFLSEPKIDLSAILNQIHVDLNQKNETFINVNEIYSIYLKLFNTVLNDDVEVLNCHVPIQIRDLSKLVTQINVGMTILKIIPWINGVNSVKKISKSSNIEFSIVKTCLIQLLHYEAIFLIDIFQYNNVYQIVGREKLNELFRSTKFQGECLEFVQAKPGIHIHQILNVYANMKFGAKFTTLVDRNSPVFSHRLLVIFGLIHGIIKRVFDYPLIANLEKINNGQLRRLIKAHASIDEICCDLGYAKRDLVKMLKQYPDFKIISK
jgi:hypothetical protein